ncbi:MAG TPA: TIGR03792 family protein [Ilumatobacter sp.]|nr:TIGR03792 family protein [Ilumatobacter sp.]
MVVEFLTFTVPPGELAEWLRVEEQHWSRFLERQPGFVRKEMWRGVDVEGAEPVGAIDHVHAVIWWSSVEAWKAIPRAELEAVVAAMGPHERTASCLAYDVLRES